MKSKVFLFIMLSAIIFTTQGKSIKNSLAFEKKPFKYFILNLGTLEYKTNVVELNSKNL